MKPDILQVRDLRVYYHTPRGAVRAVDGVSFDLRAGERLGLVGESGSGKSTVALALMRLIKPPGRIESGRALLDGVDLLAHTRKGDPAASPGGDRAGRSGGDELAQPGHPRARSDRRCAARSWRESDPYGDGGAHPRPPEDVGLPAEVADRYPHELSGGMKQRVVIAIAISLRPKVIIADEPTSALDVVVQRQVVETLRRVQEEIGASIILVGHDMGLMAQVVDRLGVMYAGTLAEVASVEAMFREPLHPYSQLLIASLPTLDRKGAFAGIPGLTPSLLDPPRGCSFRSRCPQAMERCAVETPKLRAVRSDRFVACHLYDMAGAAMPVNA